MVQKLTAYKNTVITDAHDAPSDADIKKLETNLTTQLPQSFKDFLAVANGGDLGFYYLDIEHPEMKIPRSFGFLYGTKSKTEGLPMGDFEHEIVQSRDAAQLPNEVLPVARDNSGCELYIDLTPGEGSGNVVAFIQGIEGWDDQPKDNAWITIALDWDDYLSRLKLEEVFCKEQIEEALTKKDNDKLQYLIAFMDLAKPKWRDDKNFSEYKDLNLTS